MDILTMAAWSAALFLSSTLFSHDVALRLILLALSFVLVLSAASRREYRSSLRWLPPVWVPFLLWGAWTALTQLWALDPVLSGKEWRNELFYTAIAYFTCYVAAQAKAAERIFLPLLALAAALLCADAVHDFWLRSLIDADGWHGGPGNLSGILLVLFPCVLVTAWLGSRERRTRYIAIAAIALAAWILVGAYTALNRTVWVGFTVQALGIGAFVLQRGSANRRTLTRMQAGAAGVSIIVLGLAMAALTQHERFAAGQPVSLEKDPRFPLWSVAASLTTERPFEGYGFGRGMLHEPLVRATGNPMLWHSHNLFIDAVLQTGIPGLLLLVVLLGTTIFVGWRFATSAADRTAACGVALIAVVVGMVIRNMTDLVWQRHPALLYWGVLGVLMAWSFRSEDLKHRPA